MRSFVHLPPASILIIHVTSYLYLFQVYVALLRIHQPEVKHLVQTALDILVPSIPRRLIYSDFVKAIKWTKKVSDTMPCEPVELVLHTVSDSLAL